MPEGADVTIKYEFLPTEKSIRSSAEKVVAQLNRTAGKPLTLAGGKKLASEYDKTVNSIINLLRATQQKTSLQTKILSGLKFFEGRGITGGVGGGGPPASFGEGGYAKSGLYSKESTSAMMGGGGGGGGVLKALGTIAGLLVVVSMAMLLISAFFEAVGPIIKVVMKMFSAMILILLMPFLKRGLPVLFGILKWMITMSKGISEFVDSFFSYIENVLGKAISGDPMAILELLIGPLGMIIIFLGKKIVEFLSKVDWGAIIAAIIPVLLGAFEFLKTAIHNLGTTVFGEEMWGAIENAIGFILQIFSPGGMWKTISDTIDFIGNTVFGKENWDNFKTLIGDAVDGIIGEFNSIGGVLTLVALEFLGVLNTIKAFFGMPVDNLIMTWKNTGMQKISYGGYGSAPGSTGESGRVIDPNTGEDVSDQFHKAPGGGMVRNDFISRPGMGIQAFSSGDTIIGTKNPGAIGGVNITNNLTVSAGVDRNEFKRILTEFNRQQARELRTKTSYFGGAYA